MAASPTNQMQTRSFTKQQIRTHRTLPQNENETKIKISLDVDRIEIKIDKLLY